VTSALLSKRVSAMAPFPSPCMLSHLEAISQVKVRARERRARPRFR
jgi:hypothetical protein